MARTDGKEPMHILLVVELEVAYHLVAVLDGLPLVYTFSSSIQKSVTHFCYSV